MVPEVPLPANAGIRVSLSEWEDVAGRRLAPQSWTFQTGTAIDEQAPLLVAATGNRRSNPPSAVSPEQTISLTFDEPLDPIRTMESVRSSGQFSTSVSLDPGLREVRLLAPPQGWNRGESYTFGGNAFDLAGNNNSFSVAFQVSFEPQTSATLVQAVSPADGAREVAVNSMLGVLLDRAPGTGRVRLTRNGVDIPLVRQNGSLDKRLLMVFPAVLSIGLCNRRSG